MRTRLRLTSIQAGRMSVRCSLCSTRSTMNGRMLCGARELSQQEHYSERIQDTTTLLYFSPSPTSTCRIGNERWSTDENRRLHSGGLEEHVLKCANCAEELEALRARRERLDALLPLVAQGAEAPAEFRARVLAAAEATSEAKRGRSLRVWGLAGSALATARRCSSIYASAATGRQS